MPKILFKQELINQIKKIKKSNKKIILCHGVFDIVHLGHIKHFEAAKKYGDYLVVSITKDKFIKKSFNGPLFNEKQRLSFLNSIKVIDTVTLSESKSSTDIIEIVKPDFYVKGSDYKINKLDDTKKIYLEKKIVEKHGGKVKYTDEITFSSTKIINQKNLLYNKTQERIINKIKNNTNFNEIIKTVQSKKNITVSIIGEIIFDVYKFGDVIGKSGKEPHLVIKNKTEDVLLGGSSAIARNLSSFVKKVNLISPYGFEKEYDNLINKLLPKNIKKIFFKPYKDFKSITKTRFVDISSNYKLFGSYDIPKINELYIHKKFLNKITKVLINSDLIIISDYGHGFLNSEIVKIINNSNKFKSLNAQINSSSRGFSNLEKYKKINSLIINETELRIEAKDQLNDLDNLAKSLIKKGKYKNLIVTSGRSGAKLFEYNNKTINICPAFSSYSIDKTGAGDAMLAFCSYFIFIGLSPDIILLLGSIAAASNIKFIGNKKIIDKDYLLRTLKHMLK